MLVAARKIAQEPMIISQDLDDDSEGEILESGEDSLLEEEKNSSSEINQDDSEDEDY